MRRSWLPSTSERVSDSREMGRHRVLRRNRRMIWAPAGFARGFCALSDATELQYKCTGIYNGKAESAIRWNDPAIGIKWPIAHVVVSEKDHNARSLADWLASPESENFCYSQKIDLELSLRS